MILKCLSDNYRILDKIGSGSFGEVYLTEDRKKRLYASKVEKKRNKSRLVDEYKIYECLKGIKEGIPIIYNYIETPYNNIIVMELLGPNLDSKYIEMNKTFLISTILRISIDIIKLLEQIHKMGIIHRDIKPHNFLMNYGEIQNRLYITDFGLSKQYFKEKHIEFKSKRTLIGTARYASINIHCGIEPSRRDDLESVGYMLIYFMKGKLPWQGLKKDKNKNQIEKIGDIKTYTCVKKLCSGLPQSISKYIKYCKKLNFEETPNYKLLIGLFEQDAKILNIKPSYDWRIKL